LCKLNVNIREIREKKSVSNAARLTTALLTLVPFHIRNIIARVRVVRFSVSRLDFHNFTQNLNSKSIIKRLKTVGGNKPDKAKSSG
jgi:hypothetical protein